MFAGFFRRITEPAFGSRAQLSIFGLALLVRLLFVSQFASDPVNDLLWNDAVGWNLALGNGYTASQEEPRVPGIYRSPGYPAFLAAIYSVFGHSYKAVYIAQAALDAASALLIGRIALLYWNPWMATLTALLYAIYPYPAMFCGVLHQDILLVFCTLFTLLLTGLAVKNQKHSTWFWAGLSLGITALVKPNLILLLAVPLVCIWFYFNEGRLRRAALLVCALTISLIPWVIRNYIIFHSFPPLAAGATGTNLRLLVMELNGGEEAVRSVGLAPPRTSATKRPFVDGQELIDGEKQRTRQSLKILMKRWPEYLQLIVKHIPRQWITMNSRWHGRFVAISGTILSWIVLLFGVAGMILVRKDWRDLLPLYMIIALITLMYAPYTTEARYTLPARPVMLCFVASTLVIAARKLFPRHVAGLKLNGT